METKLFFLLQCCCLFRVWSTALTAASSPSVLSGGTAQMAKDEDLTLFFVVYFSKTDWDFFFIMFSAACPVDRRTDEQCLPPSPSLDKSRCYADAVVTFHRSVITTTSTLISMRSRSGACIIFVVSCHTMATRGHTLIIEVTALPEREKGGRRKWQNEFPRGHTNTRLLPLDSCHLWRSCGMMEGTSWEEDVLLECYKGF